MRQRRLLGAAGVLLVGAAVALDLHGLQEVLGALGALSHDRTSSGWIVELKRATSPWAVSDPVVAWAAASPSAVGLDRQPLDRLRDRVRDTTSHLLVVRHRRLAYEWHHPDYGADERRFVAGVAKCTLGALALVEAVDDGLMDLDAPASRYIPAWRDAPLKSRITIRQLANHTSGMQNIGYGPNGVLHGWETAFADRARRFELTLQRAAILYPPGERIVRSSPSYYALSYALSAALHQGGESDLRDYLEKRVMEALHIPGAAWEISYGEAYEMDGLRLRTLASGASLTPRALARVGQLVLRRGPVDEAILSASSQRLLFSEHGMPPTLADGDVSYGLGWMLNTRGVWPSLPSDAALCLGALDQILLVVPSLELVAVRLGEEALVTVVPGENRVAALDEAFLAPLRHAVAGPPIVARHRATPPALP